MLILLADDEPMVCLGLKSMLCELYPGRDVFLEAANGEELIAMARHLPDVAFVDMKMPVYNGLEAIEVAKEISPDTRWFMLTGYADFSYVQQAIRLGVSDYLLKPVGPSELAQRMQAVEEWKSRSIAEYNHRFRSTLMNYFTLCQLFAYQAPQTEFDMPGTSYALALFYIDTQKNEERVALSICLEEVVKVALKPFITSTLCYAQFYLPTFELCLVVRGQRHSLENMIAAVQTAVQDMLRSTTTFSHQKAFTALYSHGIACFNDLFSAYEELEALSNLRMLCGFGGWLGKEELQTQQDQPALLEITRLIDDICMAYLEQDEASFREKVGVLRRNASASRLLTPERLDNLKEYLQAAAGIGITGDSFSQIVAQLMDLAIGNTARNSKNIVALVRDYVGKHYMDNIGMDSIADVLNVTPNYLSKLFHQHAGQKFIDYLSGVRTAAARKLLDQYEGITIKEVAERVGYTSSSHFSKVFYKYTGVYPSEYQRQRGQTR